MANHDANNGRPSPYQPAALPATKQNVPPSSVANRAVSSPYSLATMSKDAQVSRPATPPPQQSE